MGADQVATGIKLALKANLFKLGLKPCACLLLFITEDKTCKWPFRFSYGSQRIDDRFDTVRITVLIKLLVHIPVLELASSLRYATANS